MAAISVTAASVLASTSNQVRRANYLAGAAITPGQSVYLDTTTNTVKLCDADLSAAASQILGISEDGASAAGQTVSIVTYDPSFTLGGTIAAGGTVWTSATAGGVTSTAADNSTGVFTAFVGIGIGSNKILLNPVNGATAVP